MTALTLPGPAWLRECSPVVDAQETPFQLKPARGVVVALGDEWDGRVRVAWQIGPRRCKPDMAWVSDLVLDLSHETGLSHAVKGLAERHGLDHETASAAWTVFGGAYVVVLTDRNGGEVKLPLEPAGVRPESLAHAVHAVCMKETY